MPRSENRRTIEVPVPMYEDLTRRAEQEGTTIPAILQGLITDGQSMQEWFGQIVNSTISVGRSANCGSG